MRVTMAESKSQNKERNKEHNNRTESVNKSDGTLQRDSI